MNIKARTILAGLVAVVMLAGNSAMAGQRGGGKSSGGSGKAVRGGNSFSGNNSRTSSGFIGNNGNSTAFRKNGSHTTSNNGISSRFGQKITGQKITGQQLSGQLSRSSGTPSKPLNGLFAGGTNGLSSAPLKKPVSLGGALSGATTFPGSGNPGGSNPGTWHPHGGHHNHGHHNHGHHNHGNYQFGCYGHWNHWHNHINHWFRCPVGVRPCALPVIDYTTGVSTTIVTEPVILTLPLRSAGVDVDLAIREVQILRAATITTGPVYRVVVTNNGPSTLPVGARVILFGVTDAAPDQNTSQTIGSFQGIAAGETTAIDLAMPVTANACPFLLVAVEVPEGVTDVNPNNNLAQGEVARLPLATVAQ